MKGIFVVNTRHSEHGNINREVLRLRPNFSGHVLGMRTGIRATRMQNCSFKNLGVSSDFIQKLLDQLQYNLSAIGATSNMNA